MFQLPALFAIPSTCRHCLNSLLYREKWKAFYETLSARLFAKRSSTICDKNKGPIFKATNERFVLREKINLRGLEIRESFAESKRGRLSLNLLQAMIKVG